MSEIQAIQTGSQTEQERQDRILICSIDRENRRTIAEILSGAGYAVTETTAATDGIAYLDRCRFSAIITDIDMMPVDGFAFRSMIRSVDETVPILFLLPKSLNTPLVLLDELSDDKQSFLIPERPESFLLLKKLEQILSARRSEEMLTNAREVQHRELRLANSLQAIMLPQMLLENDFMEYACFFHPKKTVSREIFERIPVSGKSVTFVCGNVSGQGICSALAMMAVQSFFKSPDPAIRNSPHAIAKALNRCLFDYLRGVVYVCVLIATFDFEKNTVRCFNAGYEDLLCFHPGKGTFTDVNPERKKAAPAGLLDDADFSEKNEITMRFGDDDVFAVVSGSILKQSMDAAGEECIEPDHFRELLLQTTGRNIKRGVFVSTPFSAYEHLVQSGYPYLHDDLSILVLRKRPADAGKLIFFGPVWIPEKQIDSRMESVAELLKDHLGNLRQIRQIRMFLSVYLKYLNDVYGKDLPGSEYYAMRIKTEKGLLTITIWDRSQNEDDADDFLKKRISQDDGVPFRDWFNAFRIHRFAGVNERSLQIRIEPEEKS